MGAEGYITAGPQEVCLQLFGGLALAAALDRHSDTSRARVPEAMPIAAADPNPTPLDAPSPANTQRTGKLPPATWLTLVTTCRPPCRSASALDRIDLEAEFRL